MQKSFTYTWDEEPELDGEGQPTGNIIVTVPSVEHPEGYPVIMSADATDFSKCSTVQSIWDNQGKPA